MERPGRILLVKLSAIGDVVHTLPLLEVLRANFPAARIDWLVEEEASRIIEGHAALDQVIVSRRKSWQRRLLRPGQQGAALGEVRAFLKVLRAREYDLVIDLQGLFKSGVLTALARGRRKIGFVGSREGAAFFLTEPPLAVDYDQHALDRYLKTADYLGCARTAWAGRIPVRPEDRAAVDRLLDGRDPGDRGLIAVNPVARWKTKLWDQEKFAALADRIMEELGCRVVFTGSRGDREYIAGILAGMKGKPLSLAGRTSLKELACLYSRCRCLITTDTGPMHIAAAMRCPVLALFGPTAPHRTGPHGHGHVVLREEMDCSPCFRKRCSHRSCMKGIGVDRVFDALKGLLGGCVPGVARTPARG